ncbi:hypothetical protein [Gluconobacter roseus]|uniref:hypothetical protein n=1 Tax=Gluconobacter roseus TaxID=586239 RepID=UPI0038D05DDE
MLDEPFIQCGVHASQFAKQLLVRQGDAVNRTNAGGQQSFGIDRGQGRLQGKGMPLDVDDINAQWTQRIQQAMDFLPERCAGHILGTLAP